MSKPFQKGNPGGPGRPAGCKNKSFLNLNVWFEMIHDTLSEVPPEKKLEYIFRATQMLIDKMPALPGTPGESKSNADQALAELKAAEEYGINRNGSPATQPGSNGADVEAGATQSEASA